MHVFITDASDLVEKYSLRPKSASLTRLLISAGSFSSLTCSDPLRKIKKPGLKLPGLLPSVGLSANFSFVFLKFPHSAKFRILILSTNNQ